MCKYSEKTIYKKALNIGYKIEKGLVREYGEIYRDVTGRRFSGYNLLDAETGEPDHRSLYNGRDHMLSLEGIEDRLKEEYESLDMEY